MSLIDIAAKFATEAHHEAKQLFHTHPYRYHLYTAYLNGANFIDCVDPMYRDHVLSAIWCHDILITDVNYPDLRDVMGKIVAELVWNTSCLVKTKTPMSIAREVVSVKSVPYGIFLKSCCRMANIQYAMIKDHAWLADLKVDHKDFYEKYFNNKYEEMFNHMQRLLDCPF